MKILATLIWYDEPNEWLSDLVESLAPFVDHLVALDGPFARFDHARVASPPSNRRALQAACKRSGIEYTTPRARVYETQMDKRTRAFRICEELGTPYEDFVLVIDADEWVTYVDPGKLRALLTNSTGETFRVSQYTPDVELDDDTRNLLRSNYTARSTHRTGIGLPRLFRLMRNMTVGPVHHWTYTAVDEQGCEVALKGHRKLRHIRTARYVDADQLLQLQHSTLERDRSRIAAKAAYIDARREAGEDL